MNNDLFLKRLGNAFFRNTCERFALTDCMERGVLKSTPPWSRNPHETLESGRQSCTDRVSAGWYSKLDILAFVCLWASGDWVSLSLYRGHLVLFNWCMVHFLHTFLLLLFTPDVMLWEPVVGGSYIPMCLTIIQEKLEYTQQF